MTPKEIVERVKAARWNPHAGPEPMIHRDYIDHLLAIHAAAVEMFEAHRVVEGFAWVNIAKNEGWDKVEQAKKKYDEAKAKLADLCGWKAEGA